MLRKADFKSATGAALNGAASYQFNSGGPFVQNVRPSTYEHIDEEQFFTLQLNGPATLASVQANVWCAADGLGERVPVRLIDGKDRAALLKAQGLDKARPRASRCASSRWPATGGSRRPPRCNWCAAKASPRPAGVAEQRGKAF